MNLVKKTVVLTVAAAGIALGAVAPVRADTFAQSILLIDNFRLLRASGVAFAAADFELLTGTNDAHATAQLDGLFSNGARSLSILNPITPNVPRQSVGGPVPLGADNYTPFPSPPPVPGTFGHADQSLAGSSIRVGAAPAGATARSRADASLAANGTASGNSDVGTSTTFNFASGAGGTMTVAFDATPFTQAFVSSGAGPGANANARLSWSISIIDLMSGLTVFAFQPVELNAFSNVSRTNGLPGITPYNPGTLAFSATTPIALNDTSTYQLTIQHNTLANALQEVAVPEPGTLAVFGLGLLGIWALGRRRKA